MLFEDALVAARLGRAMLFVGSGFSLDARNSDDEPLPKTSKLTELLLAAAGRDDDVPFDVAADIYRRKFKNNPTALPEFLRKLFRVGSITDDQQVVISEPWFQVYTTNYDDVVEFGSRLKGIDRLPVSVGKDPATLNAQTPWVVHLHGYPEELATKSAPSPVLLGRISYVDSEIMRTKWPTKLQTDLYRANAIFVAGFSFADLHIARLFRETASIKRRTFIVVHDGADDALIEAAQEFGTVLPIGITGLAAALRSIDPSSLPAELAIPITSFTRFELPDPVAPEPTDVWNLLVSGTFRAECYLSELIDPTVPYAFNRNYGIKTLAVWKGEARKLILRSRIGNGKSVLLQQLAVLLSRDGLSVFTAERTGENVHDEILRIKSEEQQVAFLFDGVREFEKSIQSAVELVDAADVIVVATRSSGTASEHLRLRELLGADAKRVDLDRLEAADLRDLDALLAHYGLWPQGAGDDETERRAFVEEECDGEVRGILLHVFKSPSISARIKSPIENLSDNRSAYTVLICLLATRLANVTLTFSDICDMFDLDRREIHAAFEASGVRDLVPDSDANFRARSPVLAEYILEHIIPAGAIFDALKMMLEIVIDFRSADSRYNEALPNLLRFAFVTRAFRGRGARELILSYYEHALVYGIVRDDPQFWLQLAMARIEFEDWEPAEKALETAYQKAKRRAVYLTYMIDNQKARFLLMSATSGYPSDISENAKDACEIIRSRLTVRDGVVDVHSFRLIYPLLAFFDRFRSTMTPNTYAAIAATLKQAESVLQNARQFRGLSGEEDRAYRTLRGRSGR